MQVLERKYAQHLYLPWLAQIIDFGDVINVRGRQTKEVLDAVSVVTEPWHHCILISSRRWNPWLAMSEALWILAGRNDVATLKPYNSHIEDYSDDEYHLYGAYGSRIYNQIDILIERLRRDPSDRRAVLQIWDTFGGYGDEIIKPLTIGTQYPHQDLWRETKDPPCNNLVYFKLRDNKLHMTVICRSNDLHFGLFAVNLPTFGILQEYIAARLGVEIGNQTHISNSLHVYTDDERAKAITRRMMYDEPDDYVKYPSHQQIFGFGELSEIKSHEQFAKMCSDVLDGDTKTVTRPLFLSFASMFLDCYKKREIDTRLDNFPEFQDWTLAAKIFAERLWNAAEK